jgi:GAF domain.
MSRAGAVARCSPMPKSLSVHPKYVQEVNLVWKRKSDGREQEIAGQLGQSLCLVINNLFLKGEAVNRTNFIEICQFLGLNWQEMAGLDEQESAFSSSPVKPNSGNAIARSAPTKPIAFSPVPVKVSTVDEAINALAGTLCEMLRRLTRKAGDVLRADRTSVFLLDPQRKELGSLIADDGSGGCLIIDIPLGKGFASLAATSSKVINVPFDLYRNPRSEAAKQTDQKTGYRTYTILAWPVLNKHNNVIAVVQLINKLKQNYNPEDDLYKKIDTNGFTHEDEARFSQFVPSIQKILERCQFCYELTQKFRQNEVISQNGVVLQENELIAELRRQEQHLRKSLEKI